MSPRALAVRFTDTENYFVSEASVYRLLKAHGLIASRVFIVIEAADAIKDIHRCAGNDCLSAVSARWHSLTMQGLRMALRRVPSVSRLCRGGSTSRKSAARKEGRGVARVD